MKPVLGLFLSIIVSLCAPFAASAAEVIRSYHSEIVVEPDASLHVSETITVRAEGNDIQRGIFRDFPLYAEDASGQRVEVDFELLSVERDGKPEPYHTESISGGVRIYAGSADVYLDPGDYTYTITYTTGRQIRYFDDHDELYWNVTGNGWQFPILKASANVLLPDGVEPTKVAYFTGAYGSTDTNARYIETGDGPFFETLDSLGPNEGLSIVLSLPKGTVAAPSSDQETWWWLRDNINAIIGYGGMGLAFLYYLRSWLTVGRDPEAGVMVPRWDPPDGISPALVNYIDNKGFSDAGWTALSASLLDLAVKGYVTLDDLKTSITVTRTDKAISGKLPAGQASLMRSIGGPGEALTIDKANGSRVKTAGQQFRNAIEKEHRGKYYQGNGGHVFGGIALSVAVLAGLLIFGSLSEDTIGLLFVPIFFSAFVGGFAVKLGRGLRRGSSLVARIFSVIGLAVLGAIGLITVGLVLLAILADDSSNHQVEVLISVGGIVLINTLFFFLMGAPTPLGRKLMDGIEGLRTYMTLAEKDRLNMREAPTMSPQHFETLLPYAVALGVEKPWTKTFETWLATAAAGAAAYEPSWYHGHNRGGFGDRIGGFSTSMASTIASTIPAPPKSSSSGFSSGGGFSGGGGGGGGGGGW